MSKIKIPINQRLASKLVEENENNLTGFITETRTVFKNGSGDPIFEMHKQQRDEGEYVSYFAYVDEYKQGE